jgi:hypothetical protein
LAGPLAANQHQTGFVPEELSVTSAAPAAKECDCTCGANRIEGWSFSSVSEFDAS